MSSSVPTKSVFGLRLKAAIVRLEHLIEDAPNWKPAEDLREELHRLADRLEAIERRVEAPLIIATLGGSGTGKSTLINALVGQEVVETGRQRPTTRWPTLVCTPDLSPEVLGIEASRVETVPLDLPALREFALIDCPDPDTSEASDAGGGTRPDAAEPDETNLDRLRAILPHCDVLLLTSTQQKYRSQRVMQELQNAAAGLKILCVQTHADRDADIRNDWRAIVGNSVGSEEMFFIDAAGASRRQAAATRGEFKRLVDTLATQMDRKASTRVRRMNVERLVEDRFARIHEQIDRAMPAFAELKQATQTMHEGLAQQRFDRWKADLPRGRSHWEQRLLANVASIWGFSPFQVVLRSYLGLGALASGALLLRMRSSMQLAIWGAIEGTRAWTRSNRKRRAEASFGRLAGTCWNEATLREAAFVLRGYATSAGFDRSLVEDQRVIEEAARSARKWSDEIRASMEDLLARLARRVGNRVTRAFYEIALGVMLIYILVRPAKNFFYDSLFHGAALYGLNFYLVSLFWLALWSGLLIWLFASRARRKLGGEMLRLVRSEGGISDQIVIFNSLVGPIHDVDSYIERLHELESELRATSKDGQ